MKLDATYTYVQTATLNAFSLTQIHNAIKFAYVYCDALTAETIAYTGLLGDATFTVTEEPYSMAVTLLATSILLNSRNTDIRTTRSIEQLITPEIKDLLGVGNKEEALDNDYLYPSNYYPTGNAWSTYNGWSE